MGKVCSPFGSLDSMTQFMTIWHTFYLVFQIIPVLAGVGVVAVTAVLAKMFLFGKKKKQPVTLQDPNIKYPLKLVDKEVREYKHILEYSCQLRRNFKQQIPQTISQISCGFYAGTMIFCFEIWSFERTYMAVQPCPIHYTCVLWWIRYFKNQYEVKQINFFSVGYLLGY